VVTEPDEDGGDAPDPESLARMTSLFPVLDQCEPRFTTPLVIAPGSDLAADDVDGPWPRISEVVMGSLVAAHDHLVAVRDHVRSRRLYIYADASLLRSALLSAAQAFWILAPEERAERQRRCRTLAAHDYAEHLKYLKDLSRVQAAQSATDTLRPSLAAEAQEAVAGVAAALTARREAADERARFNATDVIQQACAVAFSEDRVTALKVLAQWRHGSAAAHGLDWHVLGKVETSLTVVDEERMVLVSRASLDDLVPTFVYAVFLLTQGFALLDLRNTGPTPF
jgi:hypothetical protein